MTGQPTGPHNFNEEIMAQNHIQKGAVMPWTNGTGAAVASGDPVAVGTLVGVALGDIADGEEGELALDEVWELPKEAPLAIAQGDKLYFSVANDYVGKTDTNVYCGKAFADAASAAATVLVRLDN